LTAREQVIAIVQQKTGNPLTVPLTGLVTSRLVDYVLVDRPARATITCSCVWRRRTLDWPITPR